MKLNSFSQELILSIQADISCGDWSLGAKEIQASSFFSKKTICYVQFLIWIQIHTLDGSGLKLTLEGAVWVSEANILPDFSLCFKSSLHLWLFPQLVEVVIIKTRLYNYIMDSMKTIHENTTAILYGSMSQILVISPPSFLLLAGREER